MRRVALFLAVISTAGCAPQWLTIRDAAQQMLKGGSSQAVDNAELPAGGYFLRVITGGHTAMLALERVEPHPNGRILVWTSGLGEVLRVQEGRLIGATGLRTEWVQVTIPPLPDWPVIAARAKPLQWVRTRDLRPGYRFGVSDFLTLRPIPAPESSELRILDPKSLSWFEERFENPPAAGAPVLPAARYAVRLSTETVVYAEQCLAPDLCLIWQRWTSELQEAHKKKLIRTTTR